MVAGLTIRTDALHRLSPSKHVFVPQMVPRRSAVIAIPCIHRDVPACRYSNRDWLFPFASPVKLAYTLIDSYVSTSFTVNPDVSSPAAANAGPESKLANQAPEHTTTNRRAVLEARTSRSDRGLSPIDFTLMGPTVDMRSSSLSGSPRFRPPYFHDRSCDSTFHRQDVPVASVLFDSPVLAEVLTGPVPWSPLRTDLL